MVDCVIARHIDTPVVSAKGPQRHNGLGSSIQLLIRLLVDTKCSVTLCDCDFFLRRKRLCSCLCVFTRALFTLDSSGRCSLLSPVPCSYNGF